MFSGSGIPAVSFDELSLEASGLPGDKPSEAEVLLQATAESIAIVLYTSGSTGIPKGLFHLFLQTDNSEENVIKIIRILISRNTY